MIVECVAILPRLLEMVFFWGAATVSQVVLVRRPLSLLRSTMIDHGTILRVGSNGKIGHRMKRVKVPMVVLVSDARHRCNWTKSTTILRQGCCNTSIGSTNDCSTMWGTCPPPNVPHGSTRWHCQPHENRPQYCQFPTPSMKRLDTNQFWPSSKRRPSSVAPTFGWCEHPNHPILLRTERCNCGCRCENTQVCTVVLADECWCVPQQKINVF